MYNKESGYGRGIADQFVPKSPIGKVFFVGASTLPNIAIAQQIFKHDPNGYLRMYSSLTALMAATSNGLTASAGDVVYVLPGHTESITAALALSVAGMQVIGLGSGGNRPYFTLTTATSAGFSMSAANVTIQNCIIDGTGVASIVSIITVSAAGCSILGNSFIMSNVTNQAAIAITTTAAGDQLTIDSNRIVSPVAGATNAIQLVGADDVTITNNYINGLFTTSLGGINGATTDCLRVNISNNQIANNTASSTKAIVLTSGTTGFVNNNRIAILSGTAPITGAAIYVGGNYYVAAAGVTAGTLV